MSDKHPDKSDTPDTPDSHGAYVFYETNDDSYDLPTLVTDEAGNALDLSNHYLDSDCAVVGEECGALDLTYKSTDVIIIGDYKHTESFTTGKVTVDSHFVPSKSQETNPSQEFYGQRRNAVTAPSFTRPVSAQHSSMASVGESLPLLLSVPGPIARPPPPPGLPPPPPLLPPPPPPPPLPPQPPPMYGNRPGYPIHHPGCTGNQEQQRCGYIYPPPPQQQQQPHSPTCCRLRQQQQQQCFPGWNQQPPIRGPFPGPGPRNVPPGNSRPPQAYNNMLSLRQPPPNGTVYNNVPRNQHNMSRRVRYAQPVRPPTNYPRLVSHQQIPTVAGNHQQHRGASLGYPRAFLNNATEMQFGTRSSGSNASRDSNNNYATRNINYTRPELPRNSPSSLRQIPNTKEDAQPVPSGSGLLGEYLTTTNSGPNFSPNSPLDVQSSGNLMMNRNWKYPPEDRTTKSPSTFRRTNSTPSLPSQSTSSEGGVRGGRSNSADSVLMNEDATKKSSSDRDHRSTCLGAIHSIIDRCFYNDNDDNDDSENNKKPG